MLLRSALDRFDWVTQQKLLEIHAMLTEPLGKRYYDYRPGRRRAPAKHHDPGKLVDRMLRYERWLGTAIPFQGARVLEVGAGPNLGWALVALARGAREYVALDPASHADMLAPFTRYFRDHRRQVERTFGPCPDPHTALGDGRIRVVAKPISQSGLEDGSFDIVLSNSVIEHVHDLGATVDELARLSARGAKHLHVVDLSDHRGAEDPFGALYPYSPELIRRLFRRRGLHINMLRRPEIVAEFARRFRVETIVFLRDEDSPALRKPDPDWLERHRKDELGVSVFALLADEVRPPFSPAEGSP